MRALGDIKLLILDDRYRAAHIRAAPRHGTAYMKADDVPVIGQIVGTNSGVGQLF
jgi:hypothetical protein